MGYTEKARAGYLETGSRFPRTLLWGIGLVKAAAAKANHELGLLDEDKFKAIYEVALEFASGVYDNEVNVDVFQTGSGTGLNLNVNEIIARHASEKSGLKIHPLDDVNKSQSSNDVVPTALRLMALKETSKILDALGRLEGELRKYSDLYREYVKPGRTHLRDALPVTFGFELEAYADTIRGHINSLKTAMNLLYAVPLGGTAVGTGANSPQGYKERVVEILKELSGYNLMPMSDPSSKMRSIYDVVVLSGGFRAVAADLYRISQDLRLLYSGPFTGIGEIDFKSDVPGSSIMPGKVNPVTLEAIMQASSAVIGLDSGIIHATTLGELELFMGYPLVAYNLNRMAELIVESVRGMVEIVLPSMKPNRERMESLARKSAALLTVLSPILGYDVVARITKAVIAGASVTEALKEEGLPEDLLEKIDLKRMLAFGE